MYSHYMNGIFAPLNLERPREQPRQDTRKSPGGMLGDLTGSLGGMLKGLTKQFSLQSLDTGDILLVLIILFLFLEGDNLELVITLGLLFLLGLNDDQEGS